jgi:uncharacterized membrane protein
VIKIERSIFIDRPVPEVFDFMTDLSTIPQWDREVISAEWISEGPICPGSTYRVVTGFLGRKIELVVEITAWEPPNLRGVKALSGPFPMESTTTRVAQGDGTLVTETSETELKGAFKLAEGLLARQLGKDREKALAALKQLLEAK